MARMGELPLELLPVSPASAGVLLRRSPGAGAGPGAGAAAAPRAALAPAAPASSAALLRRAPRRAGAPRPPGAEAPRGAAAPGRPPEAAAGEGAAPAAPAPAAPASPAPPAARPGEEEAQAGGGGAAAPAEADAAAAAPPEADGAAAPPAEADGAAAEAFLATVASPEPPKAAGNGDGAARAGGAPPAQGSVKQRHIFLTSPPGVGKTTMVQRLLAMLQKEEGDDGVEVVGFYTEEMRDEHGQRCGFDVVRVGGGAPGAPPRSALARVGQEPPRVGKYSVDVTSFEAFALPALMARQAVPELPEGARLYTPPDGPAEAVSVLEELQEDERATCRILVPSSGKELEVDASQLQDVPDGWAPSPGRADGAAAKEDARPCLCVCDEVGKMELLSVRFPPAFLAALGGSAVVLGTLPQPARGQRDHEVVERVRRRPDARVLRITRNNRDPLVLQVYALLRESLGLGPPGVGQARLDKRKAKEVAERAEREAKEKEERERALAKERDRAAKKERQAARDKERAAEMKELARKREVLAKAAREKRKARAQVRKKAREVAKSGVVMAVGDEAESDSLEFEDDVDAVEDLDDVEAVEGNVEDVDAVVDVEDKMQRVRKATIPGAPPPPANALRARPALRAASNAAPKAPPLGHRAAGRQGLVLLDEVL